MLFLELFLLIIFFTTMILPIFYKENLEGLKSKYEIEEIDVKKYGTNRFFQNQMINGKSVVE